MSDMNLSRQHGLFRSCQARTPVTVIGAGGVGSAVTFALAKMGVTDITVFDHDKVEDVNVASQFYRPSDLGRPKVEALGDVVRQFSGTILKCRHERWDGQPLTGLVVSAADCMDVRKQVWEAVKYNFNADLLIDVRMAGNLAVVLAVKPGDPDDVDFYEPHLFSNEQASPESCTARAIAYTTLGIGSCVASSARRWWLSGERTRCLTIDFSSFSVLATV